MRKRLYLGVLLLLTLSCININAEVITLDGATELANTFFSQNVSQQKRLLKSATPQLEYAWDSNSLTQSGNTLLKSVEEDPTFYVFNNPDGEGFVIVSGDDNVRQVIGYSYESNAPAADEIPDPMKDYLLGIDSEIKWARENLTSTNKNLKATEAETDGNVVKYCETPSWGQGSPFNRQCYTSYEGSVHAATGCAPTAYAEIMHYHKWPLEGIGNLYHSQAPTLVEVTDRTYDWDKMLMSYTGTYTEEQADEVAKLMSHIGMALFVVYGENETGYTDEQSSANIAKYFNYNNVSASYQKNFTKEAWKSKIKESLDNNCPIPYAADRPATGTNDKDSRHMFVLGGYTDSDYYHFNWGWNGDANGWFTLEAMTSDGRDYSWLEDGTSDHYAIFNLKPNKQVTISVAVDPATAGTVTIAGESVTEKTVEYGSSVTLQATDDNFYGWLVDGNVVSTEPSYTITANENTTYTAKFATPIELSVTKLLNLQYDETSLNSASVAPQTAVVGVNVTLTAKPYRGYSFNGWSVEYGDYEQEELGSERTIVTSVPENFINFYALFGTLSPLTINAISADENMGTALWKLTEEPEDDDNTKVYPGEQITLIATPKSGYMFTGWSVDGVTISTSKEYTVTVEEGKTYTANFALSGADYIVSGSTGTYTPSGRATTWTYNTTDTNPVALQLKATNADGTVDVRAMATSDKYYIPAFDSDGINSYNPVLFTLSVPEGQKITRYEITYKVSSAGAITISNEETEATPNTTDSQTLIWTATEDVQSTSFTLSGSGYITVTNFVVSVLSDGSAPLPTQQYTVTVSANPGTGGTATVSVGTGQGAASQTVDSGTEVAFSATPADGYQFVNWTKGTEIVSTQASFTATITANADYVANFEEVSIEEIYAGICKPTFTGTGNNTYVKAAQIYGKSIDIPSELLNKVPRGYVPTPIEVVAGEEFVLDLAFEKNWNDVRIYQIENSETSNPVFTYGPYEGSWPDGDPFTAMVADGITVNGTVASFPLTFSESLAVGELAVVRVAIGDVTTPCASVSGEGGYLDLLFVMTEPSASRTISAEANPVEGGTVTGAATAEGPITLTATPNDGYEFVNWTLNGNIVSTTLSITDNSSESKTYIANFNKLKEKAPQLTVVTATTNFATYSDSGITYSIDNIKDNNYGTKFWSNGNQDAGKYVQVDLGNIYNVEDIVLYFESGDQPDGAVVEVSETGADDSWTEVTSFVNGDIKSGTENETAVNTYSCSTESNARYVRMRITTAKSAWFQMQEFKVYGTTLPRTVTVTSSNITMGVVYITSPAPEGTGPGTGSQSPSVTTDEDVTVLAEAAEGYRFVNWTINGNQVGEAGVTTYTYTDDESATIVANFEEIPEIFTVSATVNDRTMGKATMSVTESSVEEGTSVTFTATPYTGYEFVNWTNAGGTQVSTSANYTTTISANTALTANFQASTSLGGRWFRIKDNGTGYYLNAANYTAHATGTNGGVNVIALNTNSKDQIFLFTKSGSNYTLTTKSGYNIVGQQWNVDALTSTGTAFTFVDNGNGTYYIMKGSTYFKVEQVSGVYYPFCDAPSANKATWVLEEVFISDINVTKTTVTAESTINVTTDAPATITVGTQTYTTTAENLTVEIPISATSDQDIEIEAVGGKVTSVECSDNIAPTEIPVSVTELALRNVNAAEVAIEAPLLEKITVVSEAPAYNAEGENYDYNVATLSAISDLSQGVQVVVEKEINTPQPIEGKGTPSYFNFLSMPFAFNTADIKYWDGDSWESAVAESQIRIMTYNSEIRAQGKYGETWEKVASGANIDIAANQGFVIVGNNNYGGADAGYKMKLQFTSAEAAYSQNGSAKSVETVENTNGGTSHMFDENWNHIGAPYLTKVIAPEGKTIYTHTGYNYEQYVPAEDTKTINPYQGFMLQSVGAISLEPETAVAALSLTKASESVYAKAYISVDESAPAKIILSDESSENFVVNEDAWYMAPTANVISANYFVVDGMEASVTVQPEATELPMTVYAGAGTTHTISLTRMDGERNVYLKDAVTDEIVCLNDEDYTFTSAAKTTIANRFTISMTDPTGIIESAMSEGTIKVVVAGDYIKMYGTVEGTDITLYNTNGMVITNAVAEEGVTTVATSATGVIVIKADNTVVKVVK